MIDIMNIFDCGLETWRV